MGLYHFVAICVSVAVSAAVLGEWSNLSESLPRCYYSE